MFSTVMIVLILGAGAGSVGASETYTCSLQVGQYDAYGVAGLYTGLMREDGSRIGDWDDPSAFGMADHVAADLLWFTSGWMQWNYPLDIPTGSKIVSMNYTVEISSEQGGYQTDYPSDVTVRINGVAIATWTIPGDPGHDSYGNNGYGLQENQFGFGSSQYGWLCTWTVDDTATYFEYQFTEGDMVRTKVADIKVEDLNIIPGESISIELSIPGGGGINIYGDTWGDYDFDPAISVIYVPPIEVTIDIKPGSYPNSINPNGGGVIPVAILTTDTFDAGTVDPSTVTLEGAGAKEKGKSGNVGSLEDVDGDGDLDLVVQIENTIDWAEDATEATLTGFNWDGIPIAGTDSVNIVPPE